MEPFYDGDLKDIWDTDLDPTDSLKISTETDIHDWFLEREVKDPAVILNDKLISDALFNGTVPIKSEHSYSLNSDGDSQPNSPKSLHTKMDDMEDECYPAISLKTATNNLRHNHHSLLLHHAHTATIDPKCLTISSLSSPTSLSSGLLSGHCGTPNTIFTSSTAAHSLLTSGQTSTYAYHHNGNLYAGLNKLATAPMTVNLRSLEGHGVSGDTCGGTTTISYTKHLPLHQLQQHQQHQHQQQHQQQQQYNNNNNLPHKLSAFCADNDCHSPMSSSMSRDGSISPDICSDIEIDETCIKDEPMSPDSSCPPSPNTTGGSIGLTLNMANMAAYTKSDLVFEHKNGCLQLTPASQSLLKSQQQVILGSTSATNGTTIATTVNSHNIILPKISIKTELKSTNGIGTGTGTGTFIATTASCSSSPLKHTISSNSKTNGGVYGLPLTPPSSLPSDDSEGNLTPEHLLSPLSPNSTAVTITTMGNGNGNAGGSGSTTTTTTATTPASTSATSSSAAATIVRRSTSSSSSSSSSHGGTHHHHHHRGGGGGGSSGGVNSGSSTRQPIHTPLISSQPKGSTGTLILTEEEKRTLLAEGYPIPQKLPLTKAEEKSLKKIRRKIKNKISAQESRRKKKEYMDQLERRVEILVNENNDYRKRVESLEDSNANLHSQLQKLQALINKQNAKK